MPGYTHIARILGDKGDKTELGVIVANKNENVILLKEEMRRLRGSMNISSTFAIF